MNADNPQTGSVQQQAKDTASQLSDQVRNTTSDVADQARETAKSTISNQKGRVADSVSSVADALHQAGQHLENQDQGSFAQYAHMAADRLEQFSDDLQNKSVDQIFSEVQDFARRDPQLFLGGAFVLGLLASRFLKSSASRQQGPDYQGYEGYGASQQFRYTDRYSRAGGYPQTGRSRYYGGASSRQYDQADLADYRRSTLDSEYATGRPSQPGYTTGQTGTTGTTPAGGYTTPGSSDAGFTTSGPENDFGTGMGSQGVNPPSSTKPGQGSNYNPPQRSDE